MKPKPVSSAGARRTTISDVANALGMAKGTVSRALNGYSDISEGTRLRVQNMARQMDYRPLSHAQAIRTGRVRSLGLVLQTGEYDGHSPMLADFLAGIAHEVGTQGWTLTVGAATTMQDTLATLKSLSEERKADGFIIPRTYTNDPRVDLLRRLEIPFVLYGRTQDPQDCAWYDIHGGEAMSDAVARLVSFGHRRIAFINGGVEYYYSRLRLAGYYAGLDQEGMTRESALLRQGAVTEEQGEAAALELLHQDSPPTAIICAVDRAALGVFRALRRFGLTAGQEVSVIGYDGIAEGAFARPQLTTFAVDTYKAGNRLAHLLIARLLGSPVEGLRETDVAALVARDSDGPAKVTSEELAVILRQNSTQNT
ncbi:MULTISPECIES: substrate-binding domain-containing protein [Halocynthiibacter]|uniref:Substrate-binding domain-containing protein n=1 Tax=Halocynthiibacter halioticoli TaxID=2986804 RepID=A0AAE3IY61_9RHOB|nr:MULTISPECIES: substrate-binding domain-containing protein [Halocynthiibacter]MCV6823909.1 substrate-binding domain-containing protein [Halocynthiibacter halioticoli]MCW4056910.1 substrate-binding domain-containing protein [Halocynthiibacter sp. SDUM655004]